MVVNFSSSLGENTLVLIPKTHQTNVFEARMIRLSFFVLFRKEMFFLCYNRGTKRDGISLILEQE